MQQNFQCYYTNSKSKYHNQIDVIINFMAQQANQKVRHIGPPPQNNQTKPQDPFQPSQDQAASDKQSLQAEQSDFFYEGEEQEEKIIVLDHKLFSIPTKSQAHLTRYRDNLDIAKVNDVRGRSFNQLLPSQTFDIVLNDKFGLETHPICSRISEGLTGLNCKCELDEPKSMMTIEREEQTTLIELQCQQLPLKECQPNLKNQNYLTRFLSFISSFSIDFMLKRGKSQFQMNIIAKKQMGLVSEPYLVILFNDMKHKLESSLNQKTHVSVDKEAEIDQDCLKYKFTWRLNVDYRCT